MTSEPSARQMQGADCAECEQSVGTGAAVDVGVRRLPSGATWSRRLCPTCARGAAADAFVARARETNASAVDATPAEGKGP